MILIRSRLLVTIATAAIALVCAIPAQAADGESLIAARAVPADGKVFFTLPAPDADGVSGRYIYASALRSGLGSAEVRLDRGMLGEEHLLAFRRFGKKVAVTFENARFRASGDAGVRGGGRESFPFSTIAMLDIVEARPDGSVMVDMAPFLAHDNVGIAATLNRDGKNYRLVESLSAVDAGSLKVFPDNVEIDAMQTYVSDSPGRQVSEIAADPRQVGFTVHHSFIRLPAPGFVTRTVDPRSPAGGPVIYDYGTTLGQPLALQLAARFRLEKIDPTAARSKVKKPIVFYIDRAAPEPIRSALMEGVNYWAASFEKAGFIDAFRAEILPEGADPMDVRYSMVNWSNRLTRGWSYGGGILDPRTGEIIKGNVVIGALRVRQDVAIFEGLVGTAENSTGSPNDPVRVSLDRIRQLGAHEVGHAIGFMHNFAGSLQDRTSVMDYPGPRIKLTNGQIDLSDAYAKSGGAWDDFSVDWLYGDPAPGIDPDVAARAKALDAKARGLLFMTDIDGRAADLPSPVASMWDDGPDPLASLSQMLAVRDVAIANFGPRSILPDEQMSNLRRKFVPVWLLHRYNVDAVGKLVGGLDYEYAVRGDNHPAPKPFDGAKQKRAIAALVDTLSVRRMTVPSALVPMLSYPTTRLPDVQFNNEVFQNAGAAAFDPLVAADVGAQLPLDSLLAPARLSRLIEQRRRDPSLPGVGDVLDALEGALMAGRSDAVGRRIGWRILTSMALVSRDSDTSPDAAAIVAGRLIAISAKLPGGLSGEARDWAVHAARTFTDADEIARIAAAKTPAPRIPPGMPIGGESQWFGD